MSVIEFRKKRGKAKELQLKKIGEYLELGRENCKITIKSIYDDEEIRQATTSKRPKIISPELKYYLKNSLVSDRTSFFNHGGIYKIQYENEVYIGQTNNFFTRFITHMRENQETKAGKLLLKGGYYKILAIEEDLEQRLALEKKYIKMYAGNNDYICINDDYNFTKVHKIKKRKKYLDLKVRVEDYNRIIEYLEKEDIFYE